MLSDVSVLITTFMRPGFLFYSMKSLKESLPGIVSVIVSDDGEGANRYEADSFLNIKFDSGLTAKRNAGVNVIGTKYTLLACDDFNFSGTGVGIDRLRMVLEANPEIDVAVGTVNSKNYEGHLINEPNAIREIPLDKSWLQPFYHIDIGINYFLARTEVLRQVPWDESIRPIGGEHGDWFLSMKEAGKKVVWVPYCNIETFPPNPAWEHPLYRRMRARAWQGHEIFLKKRGIKRYIGFHEQ